MGAQWQLAANPITSLCDVRVAVRGEGRAVRGEERRGDHRGTAGKTDWDRRAFFGLYGDTHTLELIGPTATSQWDTPSPVNTTALEL